MAINNSIIDQAHGRLLPNGIGSHTNKNMKLAKIIASNFADATRISTTSCILLDHKCNTPLGLVSIQVNGQEILS
ncbi:hypothetical protein [Agarivorans sp. 1_MG-2023]|uniref:hypothetical protein n=1 Tax=Agarivorans sp. 1_MG-2023 TaxID=3062634 RepID=UPI0026E2E66F|nr:hypothetical protein [Agarivorans sp. 1_MG-2023]MDO6764648.1 hypothetical protein [Agarivorans sp. 1_MG-2023]